MKATDATLATGLCLLLGLAACGNAASDARTTVDRQNQRPTPTASAQPTSGPAPTATSPAARNAEAAQGCAAFDSWEWAQTVYDGEPASHRALDPDGDGVACPHLGDGAAPATWTNQIPPAAEPVNLLDVVDGDTIEARLADGSIELVRLIGVNTPETSGPFRPRECYGDEASDFTKWLLSSGGDLYLERDTTDRDRFDRLLQYAWLDFGGEHVYLVNEAIVRSGYGEMTTYPPDLRYVEYFREAEAFARDFSLGLWQVCGDVGVSLTGQPSTGPGARAVAASFEAGGDAEPWPHRPRLTGMPVRSPPCRNRRGRWVSPRVAMAPTPASAFRPHPPTLIAATSASARSPCGDPTPTGSIRTATASVANAKVPLAAVHFQTTLVSTDSGPDPAHDRDRRGRFATSPWRMCGRPRRSP